MKFRDKETGLVLSTDNAESVACMEGNPNKYEKVEDKPQKKPTKKVTKSVEE